MNQIDSSVSAITPAEIYVEFKYNTKAFIIGSHARMGPSYLIYNQCNILPQCKELLENDVINISFISRRELPLNLRNLINALLYLLIELPSLQTNNMSSFYILRKYERRTLGLEKCRSSLHALFSCQIF